MSALLPPGYEQLAPFVAHWARDTTEGRIHARLSASMEDIRAFYDALLPLVEDAVRLIETAPLSDLPPPLATLARLVLALAQAAVAVEMHGQPRSPGTPYPNTVRVLQGAAPYG